MTLVEPSITADPVPEVVVGATVAERLATLTRSLATYDRLSNGVRDEIRNIVADAIRSQVDDNDDVAVTVVEGRDHDVASVIEERLDDDVLLAATWFQVVEVLRRRRLEPVLALHGLPFPRYPVGEFEPTRTAPPVIMWDQAPLVPEASVGAWRVLGHDVGFPIGIPSCELTCNADWIEYYARQGFHVLTYRTVRNIPPSTGSPYDWVFLANIPEPWQAIPEEVSRAKGALPRDWRTSSTATSFVAPCPEPEIWMADVKEAHRRLERLGGRHLLIVSVTDSVPKEKKTIEALCADFVEVAQRAEEAGAQAVECYLARATIKDDNGRLGPCERSIETSIRVVEAVRNALDKKTRLLIKLSATLSLEHLEAIVSNVAGRGLIDGVSGISPAEVERVRGDDGQALWIPDDRPPHRPGVAGFALRSMSQVFLERLVDIRRRNNLDFDIIAMGGVMTAEDVASYLELGASAVQTATAAVCDPNLAETAYALYRSSVEARTEDWEGEVREVDVQNKKFWARIIAEDAEAMDAEFEFDEVHQDQQREIRPGALFRWRTSLIEQGGRRVRQSLVRFQRIDPPSEDELLAGKKLAERVAEVFGRSPDFA